MVRYYQYNGKHSDCSNYRKKVLSPISDLNKATKEVAKGNFNTRLSESSWTDEIREMAHSFNIMTHELGNIETLRDDFISNVSHEFKTPISAIEGYATLLQDDELSDEERREYIHKILISTKDYLLFQGIFYK